MLASFLQSLLLVTFLVSGVAKLFGLGWNTVLRIALLLTVAVYLIATGTTADWLTYPIEEILYALVGSVSVLIIFMMLPYAIFGRVEGQASK